MGEHQETGWTSVAAIGGSLARPADTVSAIRARRATKQFADSPLPDGALDLLVEMATAAPSSFNIQDWRIVVVQDPGQRAALAAAAYNQSQVTTAPVTFVFAADAKAWSAEHMAPIFDEARKRGAWPDKVIDYYAAAIPASQTALGPARQREYAIKDAMLAAMCLMLAAASIGLDSSPMNGWVEDDVKRVIGAGDNPDIAIAALVSVGYGAGGFGNPGRLPRERTVFVDRLA